MPTGEPVIVTELRERGRIGVSLTNLRKHLFPIVQYIEESKKTIYITRRGRVILELQPYKPHLR